MSAALVLERTGSPHAVGNMTDAPAVITAGAR